MISEASVTARGDLMLSAAHRAAVAAATTMRTESPDAHRVSSRHPCRRTAAMPR